jgi:hypothetical protein
VTAAWFLVALWIVALARTIVRGDGSSEEVDGVTRAPAPTSGLADQS